MRGKNRLGALFLVVCLVINTVFAQPSFVMSAADRSAKKIRLKMNDRTVSEKSVVMEKGTKQKIKVVVPTQKKVKPVFRSSKKNIVSVSKAGKLTAKKEGNAKITVTAKVKKKKYKSWVKIKVVASVTSMPTIEADTMPTKTPIETKIPDLSTDVPFQTPTIMPTETPPSTPTIRPPETPTTKPQSEPTAKPSPEPALPTTEPEEDPDMYDITIEINGQAFSAKLYQTETTDALMEKLPVSITMNELNGNEKYYYFSESFPTQTERVSQIHAGDLKLYGSSCLVLFYESFPTSYSYTPLGYIEDPSGLSEAVGTGNVSVVITKEFRTR